MRESKRMYIKFFNENQIYVLRTSKYNKYKDPHVQSILLKDKAGLYIPSETKKVFLKYYTPTPNHLAYWTYNDRKAYIESIKSSLEYLN